MAPRMRMLWTFSSMPEFEHLSPRGRQRILRAAGVGKAWVWIFARSVFIGMLAHAASYNTILTKVASPEVRMIAAATVGLLVAAAVMQAQMHLTRITMRAQIMKLLRGECVPVCLKCGYDQAGNPTERCPECGASIRVPSE